MRPVPSCLGETPLTESKLFLASSGYLGVVLDSTVLFTHCAICVDHLQSTLLTPIDKSITYLGPMSLNLGSPWLVAYTESQPDM